MSLIRVRQAVVGDLESLVELFDGYRVYYRQPSDSARARAFLSARLEGGDSVILLAEHDGQAVGFSQLYPSFSSVAMAPIWILNDLYVATGARRLGVAAELLEAARRHALETGAVRLILETLPANRPAQALYDKSGWVRDGTWHYVLDTAG